MAAFSSKLSLKSPRKDTPSSLLKIVSSAQGLAFFFFLIMLPSRLKLAPLPHHQTLPEVGTDRTHASPWLSQDSRSQACLFAATGSPWSPAQGFCLLPTQQIIIFQQTFSSMGCLFRFARLGGFCLFMFSKANCLLSLFWEGRTQRIE